MVSAQENCNVPSDINYLHDETLSECNMQLNVGNEIFDNISRAKYSLEDLMVGPKIKDTSSLVVNEEEPLLLEPVNTDSGSLLFMFNEYDSLMMATAETRNLHQQENNLQNLFNNGDTQLLNTQFCSSMGMIEKCSNIKDNQDYEFSKELNDDVYELDITNTTSPRPINFFDSCLTKHLLHMPNDEMCRPKYCIEPQEEFTCSSSMYIADDSESDNEHKRMKNDGNTEGNKHSDIPGEGIGFAWNTVDVDKIFPSVDIIPKGFEDNIVEAKDACKQAVVHYLKDLNVTIGHMTTDELNLNFKSESGSGAYTTNSNVSDLCNYMDTDAILNERGQHSEQTTSYQTKSTLQCDLKFDPKSKIDWHRLTSEENDHAVTLSNLTTKSCTNTDFSHIQSKFELPDLQNGDDSYVLPLVINTVQDTAENISFDHTQKDNKMFSKDYMLDNLIKSHPARKEETLEPLPPPLPSTAPPPLHNCQQSSCSDSMTNMAFDALCETITVGRDYMAQPSVPSFCPFISTEDELDVQLKLDKADSMKNDFLWPKVSSIERAEEKSLHSNSCIVPETLKYQNSVKAHFPQITDWQSDLEVASLLSPYLQISNVPASGVNDNLMLEPNQDSLKIKSPSDDIVDCNMLAAEVVSRKQDMIISKYSALVEDSPLTSLTSSKETQEMTFAVLHNADFYSQNKQIFQNKGSESLTRDEKAPFQVKLNKSSRGELGINIVVTAKGAVISSIDRTSSIGQNTNIR